MKKIKFLLVFLISIFVFNLNVFAASSSLSVSSSNVSVGDKFTVTANVSSAAAWNIHVSASGPVSDCSINQVDTTADAMDANKSFSVTCNATAEGTIIIKLVGDVTSASDGKAVEVKDSKNVVVSKKIVSSNNNQNNNKSNWYNNTDNKVNNDSKEISTKIEDIKLSSGELKFNKDIYKYDIEVGYDITKLDLDIKLEDEKASVKVSGNDNLKVGNNVITIVVTGKDNKNTTYTINVNRLDRSSNSNLKGLKIKGYKIKFASDKYEYYVNIKNNDIGKSLDIEAIPEDEKARVVIGGNKDIDTGKYINIIVEAEDASTSMYTIKIINYHVGEFIYGMIGALLSIIIISIIVIIKKKRK